MKCFDRLTTQQRWLVGLGIPFLGGLLPWFLLRRPFLAQSFFLWMHPKFIFPLLWLTIAEIIVFSGVGAFCIARRGALLVVPLAVLVGYLIAVKLFFVYPEWVFGSDLVEYMMTVLVEAFVGALLGLGIARRGVTIEPRAWWTRLQQQIQAEAALHSAPPSAPAAKTQARQETIPASHPAVPTQEPAEQDDIARVLAEMQQEYAKANQEEHT